MKKAVYIYLAVLALLLIVTTAFRMTPAEQEGSELYERCKVLQGVRVGFVKDFQVNDSVIVDVTTFEALDSAGWEQIVETLDLGLTVELNHTMDSMGRAEGLSEESIAEEIIFFMSVPFHPELNGWEAIKDLDGAADAVVVSVHYRWVAIYHCQNQFELDNAVNTHIKCMSDKQMLPLVQGDKQAAQ